MRRVGFWTIAPLIGGALLTLSTARADTIDAPAEVMAQPDGSFSFLATFHKGPGTDRFASLSFYGVENVQGGFVGDCFCFESCPIYGPGDQFTFEVYGQLIDPEQTGSVEERVELCSSPGASATTSIRPHSVAGVPPADSDARFWNAPNPFSTRTTFHYRLVEAGRVTLTIHDLAGRLVARVVDAEQPAGPQQATWDLRDHAQVHQAGGVLFARLVMPGLVRTRLLIVAR